MAPPNSSSFSVSVVLPASGCEMIAKVRRRDTSAASGERAGDSAVVAAMSDMAGAFGRENERDQASFGDCGASRPAPYRPGEDDLPAYQHQPSGDGPAVNGGSSWPGASCSSPVFSRSP